MIRRLEDNTRRGVVFACMTVFFRAVSQQNNAQ